MKTTFVAVTQVMPIEWLVVIRNGRSGSTNVHTAMTKCGIEPGGKIKLPEHGFTLGAHRINVEMNRNGSFEIRPAGRN